VINGEGIMNGEDRKAHGRFLRTL